MGAIVNVYYGPPSHRRLEGQAEVVEVLAPLQDGWYEARVHFLGDVPERIYRREVSVEHVVREGGTAER